MTSVSMRQMLEAGVHFGHQTRFWNPKMAPFIFGERNKIHIINLEKTQPMFAEAAAFIKNVIADGGKVLFVGTKRSAREAVQREASRAGMPYVNQRWLGGMLTNFVTIRKRLALLDQLEARQANGDFERLSKKEASKLTDEMTRLQRTLGGMRRMKRVPGALFVIDPHREHIAVVEARKLEIPVIGTGDTNVDPDLLDYIIPANDDAIRAIRLLCTLVADAAEEGSRERAARAETEVVEEDLYEERAEEAPSAASDALLAQLAAGQSLSFAPDAEEDEEALLPVHGRAPDARPHRPVDVPPEEVDEADAPVA